MKNILLRISGFVWAVFIFAGLSGCVKDDFDVPPVNFPPVGEVVTVANLISTAGTTPAKFTEDKSLYGVITMGEKNGNIYKEAYFQDVTGAIKLGLLSSSSLLEGDSVRVYLKGGRLYNDNDQVMIDSLDVTDNIIKLAAGKNRNPKELTISDLNTGAYVGHLIKLKSVEFAASELGKTWAGAQTLTTENRTLSDCDGHTLIVRSSGYANFAGDLLPEGNGSLVAIASSYRGTIQLYIRNMDEVLLTGERCSGGGGGETVDPVDAVNEMFDGAVDNTDIATTGWTNIAKQGDRKWQGKTFDAEKYAQASGYNSGLDAMETWLITPPVTNIATKVLSFKSAKAYWSHTTNQPLTVLISTDFVGDNFETATWTELTVTMANESSSDHTWIESGEVDLSNFSGNAAIAFKYLGSNTESTSIRIDDVVIDLPGGGGGGGAVTPVDAIDEQFNDAVNYTDIAITDWTNISIAGDRKWQGKIFDAEKYAQATAYNSGLDEMETWLITPPVLDIATKKLSLKTAKAYWAHTSRLPLTVLVSEDFVGDNFETATWTEISLTLAGESDADNAWIESGEVDLSAFSGDAAIAFKFVGSATESTSYRLDDIKVGTGGGGGGTNPVYTEDFASSLGTYTGISVVGTQVWEHATYDDGCAKMSGYSGGSFENEDWLISPAYDLTESTNSVLNVRQAAGYINDDWSQIKILISTNYSGFGDPNTATWEEVTAPNMPTGTNFTFVDSGDINLSDWDGETIYVGFKYVSTAAASSTWEISSVTVK